MSERGQRTKTEFRLKSILLARCPACHQGAILHNVFGIHAKCSVCNYDFHPEPGFYLGAMAVSFLLTAMLTVPPMIALKVMKVDVEVLIAYPFIQFLFLGSFLMVYSRVLWLHLEYRMTNRLDGHSRTETSDSNSLAKAPADTSLDQKKQSG